MSDDNIKKQARHIIDKSPALKRAKDISEGGSGKMYSASDGGKGSDMRPGAYTQEFKDNFDKIDWTKNKEKPNFRIKVNGVYVDDEEIDKS
tara:strand:+ start:1455 stop:1727 length:273 start_codon:yes stop_codon:yes gene_type:complete